MMPLTRPRIIWKDPRSGDKSLVDLWTALSTERILWIGRPVDETLANELVATLLYFDFDSPGKLIQLYINASGGDVVPCLSIYDTMKHIRGQVATIGIGRAQGMSGFLLSMGSKGKRYALPHTSIMLHHPSGAARGQASDIQRECVELQKIRDYMSGVLAVQTGRSYDQISSDFEVNKYFSVEDAIEYGVIDKKIKIPEEDLDKLSKKKKKYKRPL